MTQVFQGKTGPAVGETCDAPRDTLEESERWLASVRCRAPGCELSKQFVPLSRAPAAAMTKANPAATCGEPQAPWRNREPAGHQLIRDPSELMQVERSGALRCCVSEYPVDDAHRFAALSPGDGAGDECENAEHDSDDRLADSRRSDTHGET